MAISTTLTAELRRLTAGEKAAVADYLWQEAEAAMGPTKAQLAELDRRAAEAMKNPRKLRSPRDLVRRIKR